MLFFSFSFFVFSQFFHIIIACEETMVFVSLLIVCFLVAGVVFIFFLSPIGQLLSLSLDVPSVPLS